MPSPTTTRIVFPSRLSAVPAVQDQIVDAVTRAGFADDTLFAIRLALDEALTNAVRHGNGSDPSKQVTVEFTVDPERFWIAVEDEGPGFNPQSLPDPCDHDNLCRPHGRGVMLMKAYMSDVKFNARGNRVELVKRSRCRLPRQA